jgi:hypothetical protein
MKRFIILIFCTLTGINQIHSQSIIDAFTDSDLSSNPQWLGMVEHFIVENEALRLNAPEEGESSIYSNFLPGDSTIWTFYFRLDFNPSNSNRLQIYLYSTGAQLGINDAYFLDIGESGSEDKIKLMKRLNGVEEIVAESISEIAAIEPEIRIRAKLIAGIWKFEVDSNGEQNFTPLFETSDTEILETDQAGYFGFHCLYTSTRTNKFFFDDIEVHEIYPDTIPPEVTTFDILDSQRFQITFSEPIDINNIQLAQTFLTPNYTGILSIQSSQINNTMFIELSKPIESSVQYNFELYGIIDQAGNSMLPFDTSFVYFKIEEADAYDLVINEIMANPVPAIGLPESEYLEIYNRSEKYCDLNNYMLRSGTTVRSLSSYVLEPQAYVVVVDQDDKEKFSQLDHVLGIESLFSLSNNGDDVALLNPSSEIIHKVEYTIDWYRDKNKDDGGYALEMIDYDNPCLGADNWRASESISGGTPGSQNAVFSNSSLLGGPQLESISIGGEDTLFLLFDRDLNLDVIDLMIFTCEELTIESFGFNPEYARQLFLHFQESIPQNEIFELIINKELQDCVGHINFEDQNVFFARPQPAEAGDLVINEILSDPYPEGSDFIEILNISDKVLTLKDLALRNTLNDQTVPLGSDHLVFPGDYIVLTESKSDILLNYSVQNPNWLLELELPSFNNSEGNVQIGYLDLFGLRLIDEMNYDEDMHYSFLDDLEGVSLEKIQSDRPGLDRQNWHSAAASAGYGTPTYQNSQYLEAQGSFKDLKLSSERISPDGDGYEDVVLLEYILEKPGYKASIFVYNDKGQEIRHLAQDLSLGTSGVIKWDGLDKDNSVPPLGIYIIIIEAIHPDGSVISEKFPIVMARQF